MESDNPCYICMYYVCCTVIWEKETKNHFRFNLRPHQFVAVIVPIIYLCARVCVWAARVCTQHVRSTRAHEHSIKMAFHWREHQRHFAHFSVYNQFGICFWLHPYSPHALSLRIIWVNFIKYLPWKYALCVLCLAGPYSNVVVSVQ